MNKLDLRILFRALIFSMIFYSPSIAGGFDPDFALFIASVTLGLVQEALYSMFRIGGTHAS